MREVERVTPAPQMGGSAGEGLCLVTSPQAAPMPASPLRPQVGLGQGNGISLPGPLPEGPRRTMRSLVKEINIETTLPPGTSEDPECAPTK